MPNGHRVRQRSRSLLVGGAQRRFGEDCSRESDEEALSIAASYGLCSSDGTLDGAQTKSVTLTDDTEAEVRVVGFRHDELSEGGTAGITWTFCQSVCTHQYNPLG